MTSGLTMLEGFPVDLSRGYASETHLWVMALPAGRFRIGIDALGVETSGTLAALELVVPGTPLAAGEPFGSLEAAKFVGPLLAPLSGTVTVVNDAAMVDPALVEKDPYGEGWLVEIEPVDGAGDFARLVTGADAVAAWFAAAVTDYRLKGVLAE